MILFLDFDGVLHPEFEGQAAPAEIAFCHLPRFEAIMRDYPAIEIVISSMWREQFPLETLRARFSSDIAARIVGATPIFPRIESKYLPARREAEILAWLAEQGRMDEPWLALDDADWQFERHLDRLVACTHYIGLDNKAETVLRAKIRAQFRDGAN